VYHLTTYRIYSNIYFFKKSGQIHFRLPPEILGEILCHLEIKHLFRTATVCVAWEKEIWKCPQSISPFEIKFETQRLKKFVNLTTLNVSDYMNTHINDEAISTLLKLKSLELSQHPYIRSGSQQLTISNTGVQRLVNLTHLNLKGNAKITNEGIRKLVNLTSLDLSRNELITIEGLRNLTNLSSLKIIKNNTINLDQVKLLNLPHLKHVYSDREYFIDKNKTTIVS
jgi:Leucine-rich repeat (LRR) protein